MKIASTLLAALLLFSLASLRAAEPPLNILLITADDLGNEVMDFLDGIPLTRLAERAGGGAAARAASGRVLGALAEAYGRMLFTQGPFQADPHRARPASHMALLPACLPACFARHSRAARSAASQPVRLLVCSPAVGAAASPSAARDAR
jgi:hypothetical protein